MLIDVPRIFHMHPAVVVVDLLLIRNVFTSDCKALLDGSVFTICLALSAELGISSGSTIHAFQVRVILLVCGVSFLTLIVHCLCVDKLRSCRMNGVPNVGHWTTTHWLASYGCVKAFVCQAREMENCLPSSPSIECVALVADICHWRIIEVKIFIVVFGFGMGNSVWSPTKVRQTVMSQVLIGVRILIVSGGAVALIVVDQVVARARLAGRVGAVRNVFAVVHISCCGFVSKATVAVADKIIDVHPSRTVSVTALTIRRASILCRVAIVHIHTDCWILKSAICFTHDPAKPHRAEENSIMRPACKTLKH